MTLAEVLADIFGFLLVSQGSWLDITELSPEVAARTFLTEMLCYVRRPICSFPDSGAALFELCFLEANGFLKIDWARQKILTSVEELIDGARKLACCLTSTALAADVNGARSLLRGFGAANRPDFVKRVERCFGLFTGNLDYIQGVPETSCICRPDQTIHQNDAGALA